MNTASRSRWGPPAVGGLLIVVALALVACGGSSTSSGSTAATATTPSTPTPTPTPTAIPDAVAAPQTPGTVTACGAADIFASQFTGTGGVNYWVTVKLGELNCPAAGDVGVAADGGDNSQIRDMGALLVVGQSAGVAYLAPQGEVQAAFTPSRLPGDRLVVDFTAQKIERVTLEGAGPPVELTRQ